MVPIAPPLHLHPECPYGCQCTSPTLSNHRLSDTSPYGKFPLPWCCAAAFTAFFFMPPKRNRWPKTGHRLALPTRLWPRSGGANPGWGFKCPDFPDITPRTCTKSHTLLVPEHVSRNGWWQKHDVQARLLRTNSAVDIPDIHSKCQNTWSFIAPNRTRTPVREAEGN